jgi:hypothetical protein
MATFVDKEYPIRSASFSRCRVHANKGSCQHRCTPFFWTPLTRIDLKIRNPSVAVLFARDGHQQRWGMRTALRVGAGMDDSQSVVLRDRAGMAVTVLTLQQFWIAPPGLAMTRAAAEGAHFVGWVERRVHCGSTSEGGNAAPSILQIGHTRKARAAKPQNSDCPVDFVLEAHFRLNADIARCSFRVPRVERFPPASRMRH